MPCPTSNTSPFFDPPSPSEEGVRRYQIEQLFHDGESMLGWPYVLGGRSPERKELDCVGFVLEIFHRQNVNLTHVPVWPDDLSLEQRKLPDYEVGLGYTSAQRLYDHPDLVAVDQPERGDLVFFERTYNHWEPITHVGLYAGQGRMLSQQSPGVGYVDLVNNEFWAERLVGYKRVPQGVQEERNVSGEDILEILEPIAQEENCPLELALACVWAESGRPPNPYAERWGRETQSAQLAIELEDWEGLGQIIERAWPDISFGYGQQIVKYHYLGDQSSRIENILAVRQEVFADSARALRDMCQRLEAYLRRAAHSNLSRVGGDRQLGALVIYNAGSLRPPDDPWWAAWSGNVAAYRKRLQEARELLGR